MQKAYQNVLSLSITSSFIKMRRIILYDGVCNLCLWFVSFVRTRGHFEFIKYQEAEELLIQFPMIPKDMSSVGFIDDGEVFLYSSAILRISRYLTYPSKFFCIFYVIPKFVRDPVYKYIGRNRYRWFGTCDCGSDKEKKN